MLVKIEKKNEIIFNIINSIVYKYVELNLFENWYDGTKINNRQFL